MGLFPDDKILAQKMEQKTIKKMRGTLPATPKNV